MSQHRDATHFGRRVTGRVLGIVALGLIPAVLSFLQLGIPTWLSVLVFVAAGITAGFAARRQLSYAHEGRATSVRSEVNMRFRQIPGLGALVVVVLGCSIAQAGGLPICRVRVVRSAAAEAVSRHIVRELESWVDARDRGCILVPSIAEADVLLELNDYSFKFWADATPVQEWWFVARRLAERNPEKATYRFSFMAPGPLGRGTRHVSELLPLVLTDVCLGLLPVPPPHELHQK
jgi:hypothetical protein